jgi:hypothetical protein
MRSLLFALCAVAMLTACAEPQVVSLDALPAFHGDASRLFLLTPSATLARTGSADKTIQAASQPTRVAGRVPEEQASGKPAPLALVDGWVITQRPDFPAGTSSTLTIANSTTDTADTLRVHASRYDDDLVATTIKATFVGARARVRDAYVLNTRYFGLQLSDERFVVFDRTSGKFVDPALDLHGTGDVVYVDKAGQPYIRRHPDGEALTAVKRLEFPGLSLEAPLSPAEVFKADAR